MTVSQTLPGTVHQVESCWYDTGGWPLWVDGLDHVEEVGGSWPQAGGWVRWRSGPAGRGEVTERVRSHEPLSGQTVEVQDEAMEAEQTVSFTPEDGEHVTVSLTLEYQLRRRNVFTPLVDRLFIRSALRNSLQTTLDRFGRRLAAARQ